MSAPLSNALDFQSHPSSINQKFGTATPHVQTLFNAVIGWVSAPVGAEA